jgi:uncharacterized protein YcfJ
MFKRLSLIAGLSVTALASAVSLTTTSAGAREFQDVATVISSTPIYERVSTPRRECYNEQVTAYEEHRSSRRVYDDRRYEENRGGGIGPGTVLGAVLGGAIGHQFGNSSGGRDRGTAAGAIIGGLIGHDAENRGGYDRVGQRVVEVERVPVTRDVQRCQVVQDYREEIRGYDVRYQYQGREYTTRTSYDPGRTIPVNVQVRPEHHHSGGVTPYYSSPSSYNESRYDRRYDSRQPTPTYVRSY